MIVWCCNAEGGGEVGVGLEGTVETRAGCWCVWDVVGLDLGRGWLEGFGMAWMGWLEGRGEESG
jgi:hypothetical protein